MGTICINKRGIRVLLNGGLGNQLFQYYAGLYVAKRSAHPLYLDLTRVEFGRLRHTLALFSMTVEGSALSSKYRYSPSHVKHMFRIKCFRNKESNSSTRINLLLNRMSCTYTSPKVGFDANLDKIDRPVRIEGYFQTWKYYHSISANNASIQSPLCLVKPSEFYAEMLTKIRAKQTLSIHVRRGDYTVNKESFGLLSLEYYVESIAILKSRGFSWDQAWLFTDDVESVTEEFRNLIEAEEIEVIQLEELKDPAEVMMLMSNASVSIIANSTFSWWAATLGEKIEAVVCPSKWFKTLDDPQDLLPISWIKVDSLWV